MHVLVFGSRTWEQGSYIEEVLEGLGPIDVLIHGDARGADRLAAEAGHNLPPIAIVEAWPANWNKHGRAAGPIRNREMLARLLELGPPYIAIGFRMPGKSNGTDDMYRLCLGAGVPVIKIHHREGPSI